jgi:hypothetical protein
MIQSWLTGTTTPFLALHTSSIGMPRAGSLHSPAIDTLMRISLLLSPPPAFWRKSFTALRCPYSLRQAM